MKKLFTLVLGLAFAVAASAQYVCTKQGTVLNYTKTAEIDNKNVEYICKTTVTQVTDNPDGTVTVILTEEETEAANRLNSHSSKEKAIYNPADTTTTIMFGDPESVLDELISTISSQAASAGHMLGESDLQKIRDAIKVKGELPLKVNPNYPAGAKQPNQTMRIDLGQMGNITMNLWEIKAGGRETIEVPAGTYDCLKYSVVLRTSAMGQTEKNYLTLWFAEGIGNVRTVLSDKKGKTLGEEVLTSIK